ncbi:MAG: 30S ribosome-binding factor RbfA [Proteobacteria bacterium]|nr:30S ribosome-binding factor RbfA [Pseudomonadota bacterium]
MTRSRGSGPPGQRQLRVGEEIRHALARILARGELRDPDLVAANVTVTEVRISPDLKHATAFVTPFGGGDAAKLVQACRRAAGYFRSRLADEVKLRHVPVVTFEPDRTFDHAQRIDTLLQTAKPPPDDDAGGAPGSDR